MRVAGDENGVVKVSGVFSVNGDERKRAQIFQTGGGRRQLRCRPLGFRQHGIRERSGDVVIKFGQIFLNAGIIFPSQRAESRGRPQRQKRPGGCPA